MARKAFSIHSDFYDELRRLTPEGRSNVLLALINWSTDTEPPQLDSESAILFRLICSQIERISAANSANGGKGGRPPKSPENEESEKSEDNPKKRK